ncbi:hypothetical protein [Escherichia coli]|nr:hypothetical protein [Escherichia coli]MDY9607275.1 protein YchT [Escherichia coli]MDY9652337.1 protein YchT [Escherichia coli]MDY9755486.1 protein YchT [Escherichia coli]MDY9775647.1 protein YchT [Escherichia coli]MED9418830.1 protein YchT [Escherichia coli]
MLSKGVLSARLLNLIYG